MTQTDGEIHHAPGFEESIVKMTILTKSYLQVQCNPYQITNCIFHRIRTKNFTICMETQKTMNSQSNIWERKTELEESGSWASDYAKSYSNQDSMVLAQKQKYRSMVQDRKPRDNPMHLRLPYL